VPMRRKPSLAPGALASPRSKLAPGATWVGGVSKPWLALGVDLAPEALRVLGVSESGPGLSLSLLSTMRGGRVNVLSDSRGCPG
jgi:hypothetical protein